MLQKIKRGIKANRFLAALITPFIDKRIHYKILKFLDKPFNFKLLNGSTLAIYPNGQIALGIFQKAFERQEINTFQKIIKQDMTIVDAGANIGLYSLIASKLVGDDGRVFSFEPSKETFKRFMNNIKLNQSKNITAFNNGLGDKIDEKLLLRQEIGYGDAERYLFPNNEAPNIKLENTNKIHLVEEVYINTLDNCLKTLNIQKIDFMKIDTEGFEYYILKGAKEILHNSPNIIILMECTPYGTARAKTTQKEVFKILQDNGLNIFYWNHIKKGWNYDEEGILKAGDVWACRNMTQLS